MDIKTVVNDFANRLSTLIESQAMERARTAVLSAFGSPPRRGPGRPPKAATAPVAIAKAATAPAAIAKKARKKPPLQLCPVPGCKNPAAPVFGMVCAKHKDLPKSLIKTYREARKAKKLGLKPAKVTRRRSKKAGARKTAATASSAAAA
jgi:hypothetical protein